MEKGKLLFFGLYTPEEGRVDENKNFYNQLQKTLHKTNKNDYTLLSRDLNSRIGNTEIHNTVGCFREQVTNINGLKLGDVAMYNNTKIMNTFYNNENIHTHTWSVHSSKTFIDYFIAHRKLPEVFLTHSLTRCGS